MLVHSALSTMRAVFVHYLELFESRPRVMRLTYDAWSVRYLQLFKSRPRVIRFTYDACCVTEAVRQTQELQEHLQ